MIDKNLISFGHYQESLLEEGLAIAASCDSEYHGKLIFNQVVQNPKSDLVTLLKTIVSEVLAKKFQKYHRNAKSFGVSDDEYDQRLLDDFAEQQELQQGSKEPKLEWVDQENPRSGVVARMNGNLLPYFDVRAYPRKFKEILAKAFGTGMEPSITKEVLDSIDYMLEELETDLDADDECYLCEWDEMERFEPFVLASLSSQKKRKMCEKAVQDFMARMLSPILDQYAEHLFYIASEDSGYFVVGGSSFYLIIAGARLDGSSEITIFKAVNEY